MMAVIWIPEVSWSGCFRPGSPRSWKLMENWSPPEQHAPLRQRILGALRSDLIGDNQMRLIT